MKTSGKKKWIAAAALIVILASVYAATTFSGGVKADVITVEKGEVCKLIREVGTVESDNSIIISSAFTGEIKGLVGSTGDLINAGELLLTSDNSVAQLDIKSLRGQLSGLEISYSRAKEIADRNKILFNQGALSREEYDAALASKRELEAQVSSLRYSIESYAKASGISGITSPIKGTITDVFIKEGEYVSVGTPLFEVADLDMLYIRTNLIAEDADVVETGNEVLIYAEKGDLPLTGSSVRRIHFKAKEEVSGLGIIQKRVTVEVEILPDVELRLGSDVDLAIIVAKKKDVLRIPIGSRFQIEGNSYVYVAEGGRARLREIEIGLEGDDYVEIVSGLSDGETVILSPGNDIDDGKKISLQTLQRYDIIKHAIKGLHLVSIC